MAPPKRKPQTIDGQWNVVSTAPVTSDGWNVVDTKPTSAAKPTPAPQQGFASSFLDSSGLSGIGTLIRHPLDSTTDEKIIGAVKGLGQSLADNGRHAAQSVRDVRNGDFGSAIGNAAMAVPLFGGTIEKAANQVSNSPGAIGPGYNSALRSTLSNRGAMGTLTGAAAGPLLAEGAGKVIAPLVRGGITQIPRNVADIPSSIANGTNRMVQRAITVGGDLDEPILGTNTTPRLRYQAAKRLGVNLDLADATNAPIPRALKAVNNDSLLGSHVYENAKVANKAALTGATDSNVESMSPLDRQTGGNEIQGLYQADHAQLLQASRDGHSYIQANYGDVPLGPSNSSKLFSVADDIKSEQGDHNAQFPSLKPGKVAAIVDDASKFGKPDSPFAPDSTVGGPTSPPTQPYLSPTVGDALKARSGILDVYQNNPEIVKSAADAQLQRLTGGVHDAVMDTLPPDAQTTLRDAQLKYKEAKQVYDNPSSPLFSAVRTPNPESLVTGPSSQTPSALDNVLPRIGEQGRGIIQRGVAEKALGEAPGGGYNFQSFPRKLSAIPDDYASALFGDKLPTLQDISDTSQALSKDLNPSGSAKQGQKLAEAVGFIPSFGAPALQYPLAKLLNSPSVVNYVMRDVGAPALNGNAISPAMLPTLSTLAPQKTGTR